MMRVVKDRERIERGQKLFSLSLDPCDPQRIRTRIGYQSGHVETTVQWIQGLGIWAYFGVPPDTEGPPSRYWNAFGLGRPGEGVEIVCEINPPLEGINRRVAGAFAQDSQGNTGVLHRGIFTIAGGITKRFFQERYSGQYISVIDGTRTSDLILVGMLQSEGFPDSLRDFIVEVDRIKEQARKLNQS